MSDKPTLDLALVIARWDDTRDAEANSIPHWAMNLAMALIESDWLAEHDRQVAERAWREGVRSAFGRSIEDPYWTPADIQDLNQYRKDGE